MRPVQVMEQPITAPHVCAKCGVNYDREHYTDLGIDTIFSFADPNTGVLTHWVDGVVYFCNSCMSSLFTDYEAAKVVFNEAQESVSQADKDAQLRVIKDSIAQQEAAQKLLEEELGAKTVEEVGTIIVETPEGTIVTMNQEELEVLEKEISDGRIDDADDEESGESSGDDSDTSGDDSATESHDESDAGDEHEPIGDLSGLILGNS